MAKEFRYRGKTAQELQAMTLKDIAELFPSEKRRNIKRGFSFIQKKLLEKVREQKDGKRKKPIKTHARDMVILPEMFGLTLNVHNGKEFVPLEIKPEMVGWNLGDFVLTRKDVKHSAAGVGATRGSKHQSVK